MSCQSLESVNHFNGLSAAFIALFAQKKSIFSSSLCRYIGCKCKHTTISLDLLRPCAAVLKLNPGVLTSKKKVLSFVILRAWFSKSGIPHHVKR